MLWSGVGRIVHNVLIFAFSLSDLFEQFLGQLGLPSFCPGLRALGKCSLHGVDVRVLDCLLACLNARSAGPVAGLPLLVVCCLV